MQVPTSHFNNLSLQSDHSPASLLLEGDPRRLLHVLGHQSVPQSKVERWPHALILDSHHVKETRTLLWGVDGGRVLLPHFHLSRGRKAQSQRSKSSIYLFYDN